MLRDAVDAAPQDVTRRVALVRTLLLLSQPELAAKEARRAAELLPDKIELRAMAARAWMQAGREDEAMADLNEAVARDPNSVETRTLLAEVNLSKGRPQQALEHLDAVLKEKPTGDIWFQHALCKAMLGKRDDVVSDLAEAKKAGMAASPQDVAARYGVAATLLDKSVTQIGNDVRSLMQRAQVRRTDPEVGQIATTQRDLTAAWAAFLDVLEVPQLHRSSHDRRVLAFNLLSQSLGDLGKFLSTNDEDSLAESRINLGEALKQYGLAQSSYKDEIGGIAKRVGSD
jgi:tetratricopeptide (TPR) repeat protein